MTGISCIMLARQGREAYIENAVKQFIRQRNIAPIELIVVHSDTDAFGSWLSSLLSGVPSKVVFHSGTLGAKRNRGIFESSYPLVATWDDDDMHAPDRLAKQQCAILQNNGNWTAECRYLHIFEQTKTAYLCRKDVSGHADRPWQIVESSMVARRDLIMKLGGYSDKNTGEDTDLIEKLWHRAFRSSVSLESYPEIVFGYVCTGSGMMSTEHHQKIVSESTRMHSRSIASGCKLHSSPQNIIPEGYKINTSDGLWEHTVNGVILPYT